MRAECLAFTRISLAVVSLLAAPSIAVFAQQPPEAEVKKMRQCDRDLCAIITAPHAGGGPLQCDITQTWHQEEIAKAVKKGRITWPFGDARCKAKFEISRALLTASLNQKTHTLKIPPQPVSCEIDSSGAPHVLTAKMGPVIEFENGKAKSVSLGFSEIDGTAMVRNVVWAAWKFESYFGYFQADFVKGVNDYITEHCPNRTEPAD